MKLIRVGAAVLNQTPLAWEKNKSAILTAITEAKQRSVSILCLPELCISGYGCEDTFHSAGVQCVAAKILEEIVPHSNGLAVCVGLPLLHQGSLFDAAAFLVDGELEGFAVKRFLAGEGIHYEPRWFKPWPAGLCTTIPFAGRDIPIGDLVFDLSGIRVGFEICEDAWAAKRPGADLAVRGVDLILNPSASHFAFGKYEMRKRFVCEGSRAFNASYVYANLLGNESGRAIYDGGALIASNGRLVASGPRFSFAAMRLTDAVIDIDATRTARARSGSFKPELNASTRTVVINFHPAAAELCTKAAVENEAWEVSAALKFEEFTRAESLALYDVLRKSGSRGFVVSISGGADSAAVSCLVYHMVVLGVAELGFEAFVAKLPFAANYAASDTLSLMRELLLCVYQATANSSVTTRAAARSVARAIGASFAELEVEDIVKLYRGKVEAVLGRTLTWEKDDIALQNIQARVRAPSVWMLANVRRALLLATSNRSEAAVGYATMDGDTAGGFSPLGGIDKDFIRRWLRWLEKEGAHGCSSVPALRAVNELQPTAELRPEGTHQTDEQDLMPYEVLDRIERAAILDRQTPCEIFERLRAASPDIGALQLQQWIDKFFRLWCRNQWKRERYAPSFHLDDESLDPKTWCRFPILSGGYEFELAELRQKAADSKK